MTVNVLYIRTGGWPPGRRRRISGVAAVTASFACKCRADHSAHFPFRRAPAHKAPRSLSLSFTTSLVFQAMLFGARNWILGALAALALASTSVEAHGNLVKPQPTFNGYGGGYPSVIQSSVLKGQFVGAPDANAAAFDAAFKAAGKSSLKDFILANQDTSQGSTSGGSAACGFSLPGGTAQALPDTLQWGTGFIHPGPCEAYCDGEIVVPYTANCWKTFSGGNVPYSKSKCTGKKQLTFYWLAVHGPPWQVYINCVPLSGGSSSGSNRVAAEASGASGGASTTTKAPTSGNTGASNTGGTNSNGGSKTTNTGSANSNTSGNSNNGNTNNLNFGALSTNSNSGNGNTNSGNNKNTGNSNTGNTNNWNFGALNNNSNNGKKNLR